MSSVSTTPGPGRPTCWHEAGAPPAAGAGGRPQQRVRQHVRVGQFGGAEHQSRELVTEPHRGPSSRRCVATSPGAGWEKHTASACQSVRTSPRMNAKSEATASSSACRVGAGSPKPSRTPDRGQPVRLGELEIDRFVVAVLVPDQELERAAQVGLLPGTTLSGPALPAGAAPTSAGRSPRRRIPLPTSPAMRRRPPGPSVGDGEVGHVQAGRGIWCAGSRPTECANSANPSRVALRIRTHRGPFRRRPQRVRPVSASVLRPRPGVGTLVPMSFPLAQTPVVRPPDPHRDTSLEVVRISQ